MEKKVTGFYVMEIYRLEIAKENSKFSKVA